MSSTNRSYSQIAFALEILRLLSKESVSRDDLAEQLESFLAESGKPVGDLTQKITRTIRKLRDCGFEIESAPNRPYKLIDSRFSAILTAEQKESLTLAAYLLESMGFSAQGSQVLQLTEFKGAKLANQVKANFSPPVDYSEEAVATTVKLLQDRFQKRRRYTIRYRSSRGKESTYDLDKSELRLHSGVLYLFAFAPDFSKRHHIIEKNQIFRVDRIQRVGPASNAPWNVLHFPTLDFTYRMSSALSSYQPRRDHEKILKRDSATPPEWVEIITTEESLFWLKQRLFQYRSNVEVLSPTWFVKEVATEMFRAAQRYWPSINKGIQ